MIPQPLLFGQVTLGSLLKHIYFLMPSQLTPFGGSTSQANGFSAGSPCGHSPFPFTQPKEEDPCFEVVYGKCLDIAIERGETYRHGIYYFDANTPEQPIVGITPNIAGGATIRFAKDAQCLAAGDKFYLFGICDDINCGNVEGVYTVLTIAGDLVTVVEGISGTAGVEIPFTSGTGSLCQSNSLPLVGKLMDLTNVEFEMVIVNRDAQDVRYRDLRAATELGSNEIKVCPAGQVCTYDSVTLPGAGIVDAQAYEVYSADGYDIFKVRNQVASQTSDCLSLSGHSGVITPLQIDETTIACGFVEFYLGPDAVTDVNGQLFLGTSDLVPGNCESEVKEGCPAAEKLGRYFIRSRYTDPGTGRVVVTYHFYGDVHVYNTAPPYAV